MKSRVICLLLGMVLSGFTQDSERSLPTATWIFLNSGPGRSKNEIAEADLAKMQSAHVANFGALFDQGKLFAAGPLGDNGIIRGIVLLNATTPAEANACFASDPLVKNQSLETEQHPCLLDVMNLGTPEIPFKMMEHTLCIVKKGQNWEQKKSSGPDVMIGLFPSLKSKYRLGESLISAAFLDSSDKVGVLLFSSTNQTQIRSDIEGNASVKKHQVELEFHPQLLGAGLFKAPDDLPPKTGKRTVLFDGKSFQGWEGDTQHTWRIENEALVGGNLAVTVPHNDFICTTREFKNFDLRLKLKVAGTGFVNGGVQFRSQRLKNPAFEMTGYQADMGEGWWGCLYDESRRNKVLARPYAAVIKKIVRPNDWNDYIILCEDGHIRLWLNGVLTVDYTEPDASIARDGFIGFQIHGGGKAEASYKEITIRELD